MSLIARVQQIEELSAPALTVRAQVREIPPLRWTVLMPRTPVDSIRIRDAIAAVFRPVADRREWNGEGRRIPMVAPALRELEMIPVEATDRIEEYELQRLYEMNLGGAASQVDQLLVVRIPQRVDVLVDAVYNRLEIDGLHALATGTITARDPQTGRAITTPYGIDPSRYAEVDTAWTDDNANAYDAFITWLRSAIVRSGPMAGVGTRTENILRILRDAPLGANGVRLTLADLNARVGAEIGSTFAFVPLDDTLDVFVDGGTETTPTKVWPGNKIAAIPAQGRVGVMAFAPQVEAGRMAEQVPTAGIDVRGAMVTMDPVNRGLWMAAGVNAMPILDPNRVEVLDVGTPA